MSEKLFEMTYLRKNAGIECLSPLVDCFVYYTVLDASPGAHQLRICHVLYCLLTDFVRITP